MTAWRGIRFWRRLCQGSVILGFALIPLLNIKDITLISGNFLSLNIFGLTFVDPLASLQTMLGGGFAPRMLFGAGLVLLTALLLGRIFCGWLCPYGFASELIHAAGKRRAKKSQPPVATPIIPLPEAQKEASTPEAGATGTKKPASRTSSLRILLPRVLLCAAGLAIVPLLPGGWLNQFSMPGWYTRFWQQSIFFDALLYGALSIPLLLLLEAVFRRRIWCRYLCPQSLLLALMAAPPAFLRVRFTRHACTCSRADRVCTSACSLGLNPRAPSPLQRMECTNCGDCVDVCQGRGKALSLSLGGKRRIASGSQRG